MYEKALDAGLCRQDAAARAGVSVWTAREYEGRIFGVTYHADIAARREDFGVLRDRGLPLDECALRLGVTERTIFRYEKRRKAAHAT